MDLNTASCKSAFDHARRKANEWQRKFDAARSGYDQDIASDAFNKWRRRLIMAALCHAGMGLRGARHFARGVTPRDEGWLRNFHRTSSVK